MKRILALILASALLGSPAVLAQQGKSTTAPGKAGTNTAPGLTGEPKTNAPGQIQKETDQRAKDVAPGATQRPLSPGKK